jgi:hypothetical protein
MSTVTESDISRSFQAVWASVFGGPLPAVPTRQAGTKAGRALVGARVRLMGEVPQSVVVVCSLEQARRLTAGFFGLDQGRVDDSLVRDVFGELANMIGGLIKRHFSTPCRLSLPEVREVQSDEPEAGPSVQAFFESGDAPVAVRLVQTPS